MRMKKQKTASHITLIAQGTEIKGDIEFAGAVQIEGKVKGSLRATNADNASVMIVKGAEVVGDITAPEVMINGQVRGDVYASVRVELAPEARIEGDVRYRMLEMLGGAQINGALIHEEHQGQLPAPDAKTNDDAPKDETIAE